MIEISLNKSQINRLSNLIDEWEDSLFEQHDLERDENFRPYYFDDSGQLVTTPSDPLISEVVDLDELSSILDSARTKS